MYVAIFIGHGCLIVIWPFVWVAMKNVWWISADTWPQQKRRSADLVHICWKVLFIIRIFCISIFCISPYLRGYIIGFMCCIWDQPQWLNYVSRHKNMHLWIYAKVCYCHGFPWSCFKITLPCNAINVSTSKTMCHCFQFPNLVYIYG